MSESEIARLIARLMARLDSIEGKVDALAAKQDQWTGAVGLGKWLLTTIFAAVGLVFVGFREFGR